jgi:hypothetical protein
VRERGTEGEKYVLYVWRVWLYCMAYGCTVWLYLRDVHTQAAVHTRALNAHQHAEIDGDPLQVRRAAIGTSYLLIALLQLSQPWILRPLKACGE